MTTLGAVQILGHRAASVKEGLEMVVDAAEFGDCCEGETGRSIGWFLLSAWP